MEIVEFLTACLDEDERIARAATLGPWTTADHDDQTGMLEVRTVHEADIMIGYVADVATADALHIAEWDPARVLREIDAKRRILSEHALNGWVCSTCDNGDVDQTFPCPTLRLLALPYADRPGYREEWAP